MDYVGLERNQLLSTQKFFFDSAGSPIESLLEVVEYAYSVPWDQRSNHVTRKVRTLWRWDPDVGDEGKWFAQVTDVTGFGYRKNRLAFAARQTSNLCPGADRKVTHGTLDIDPFPIEVHGRQPDFRLLGTLGMPEGFPPGLCRQVTPAPV